MSDVAYNNPVKLSIVIPCYNEQATLSKCVNKVLEITDDQLSLEIIIVDDCSTDKTLQIAYDLEKDHPQISVVHHEKNRGKGAALRTGFQKVTGDFVAIQDADLEYDPRDLKKILTPLINNDAEVVFGSRFLSAGMHRVLYFWHYMGNRFLTFLSNMFTDLNLTDMETCYKVFRRDVIQNIEIEEDRFGFEPEIVAKVAQMRLRIYEMGISYYGRTYEEGKKIGMKDGFRAIYCILRYNANRAPLPVQLMVYIMIGGVAALVNYLIFLGMFWNGCGITLSASTAFVVAAMVNYLLCIMLLFRHRARWNSEGELAVYFLVTGLIGVFDLLSTKLFFAVGLSPGVSKLSATAMGLFLNFLARRFLVFPEPARGPWKPQLPR